MKPYRSPVLSNRFAGIYLCRPLFALARTARQETDQVYVLPSQRAQGATAITPWNRTAPDIDPSTLSYPDWVSMTFVNLVVLECIHHICLNSPTDPQSTLLDIIHDGGPSRIGNLETQTFGNARRRTISTAFASSPDPPQQLGLQVIKRAAIKFGSQFERTSSLPPPFDADAAIFHFSYLVPCDESEQSRECLYGRHRVLFRPQGLEERATASAGILHIEYGGNSVAHVLDYHHCSTDFVNPMMILSFVINPRILLGLLPNENRYTFRTKSSAAKLTQAEQDTRYVDFVIAPMCEVSNLLLATDKSPHRLLSPMADPVGIGKSVNPRGPRLVQVAACSQTARNWLNAHIVEVAQEQRGPRR
ncbi:hypothetical protein C8R44DRAFT_885059 [Mycena epipterygia]|nr:hypothetical protein C8R44DRAFT_885059 [Mycena epipterygia]